MKTVITQTAFVNMLRNSIKGTAMLTVDLDSDMDGKGKMNVTNNPYAKMGVTKREVLNGVVGYNYGNAINRLAAKEGQNERDAKRHPWGDMDDARLFRIHRTTGERYLSMMVRSSTVLGYFYPSHDQIVTESIKPFIPIKTKSSSQTDLDGEVIARDYKLSNIKGLSFNGAKYLIVADNATGDDIAAASAADRFRDTVKEQMKGKLEDAEKLAEKRQAAADAAYIAAINAEVSAHPATPVNAEMATA